MNSDVIVCLRDVCFRHPQANPSALPLFDRISIEITRGSFVSLMGPSGVGKSTLLRLIGGLIKPQQGQIAIMSAPGHATGQTFMPCGFVFQDARLLPWRKSWKNVALGLEGGRLSKAERRRIAFDMLQQVGMAGLEKRLPGQLSGGQRQRVAIARALAVSPDLLLMDEPFSALDAITRQELHQTLRQIVQNGGKTVIFVTHDQHEADLLATRQITLGGTPVRIVGDVRLS